jgi:hypothetical protein
MYQQQSIISVKKQTTSIPSPAVTLRESQQSHGGSTATITLLVTVAPGVTSLRDDGHHSSCVQFCNRVLHRTPVEDGVQLAACALSLTAVA